MRLFAILLRLPFGLIATVLVLPLLAFSLVLDILHGISILLGGDSRHGASSMFMENASGFLGSIWSWVLA